MADTTRNDLPEDISHASTPKLFAGLIADAKEIATAHLGKMRTEINDEFKVLKRFLLKIGVGIGVGVLGLILFAHTFALVLNAIGLWMWLAYLISSVIAVGLGFLVLRALPHDKTDMDLVPESTLAELKRDIRDIRGDMRHATQEARAH